LLQELRQALLKQQRCQIQYRPAKRRSSSYLVDPYTLLFFKNALYLGGYAHNRQALRLFAIERIESLERLTERFEVPEDYSADALTGAAFGLIDDGATQQVELLFDKEIAHLVRERIWHPDQQLEKGPEGSLLLRFEAAGDKEILSWIYSFVPHVRVLGPPLLQQQFVEGLTRGLEFQIKS
ncbi:MAG: WYL domain-containing protein, partial [Deltaproteobacteria bacterium]|nr:WYL domain-containing protein [Deltaproteobacteria bacterium]